MYWRSIFQKRCQVEGEVKYLRDTISQLKVSISTITKGVSMSKIEVIVMLIVVWDISISNPSLTHISGCRCYQILEILLMTYSNYVDYFEIWHQILGHFLGTQDIVVPAGAWGEGHRASVFVTELSAGGELWRAADCSGSVQWQQRQNPPEYNKKGNFQHFFQFLLVSCQD